MSLIQELNLIDDELQQKITLALDISQITNLKEAYFGKKGKINELMKEIRNVSPEEKPLIGQKVNQLKQNYLSTIDETLIKLKRSALNEKLLSEAIDITLPAERFDIGEYHPIKKAEQQLIHICESLGFSVATGPIIEDEFHNFEALNIPDTHPSRDMHDTFYLKGAGLLRTHTSSVQIRYMKQQPPPIKIIAPGQVFRCDADKTHSPMFHQLEGLYVNKQVSLSELKYCLETLLHEFFNGDFPIRYRSSYFPFTEPSFEVDIGFDVDGQTEWMEVLGAGMVHRNVLRSVGYDPDQLTGFAFGLGIDRLAMLKYGIRDIRSLYDNDIRFLRQGVLQC